MVIDQQPDIVLDEKDDSDDELKMKSKYLKYDVESSKLDSSGLFYKDSDSELEMDSDSDNDEEKESLGIMWQIMKYLMINFVKNYHV